MAGPVSPKLSFSISRGQYFLNLLRDWRVELAYLEIVILLGANMHGLAVVPVFTNELIESFADLGKTFFTS